MEDPYLSSSSARNQELSDSRLRAIVLIPDVSDPNKFGRFGMWLPPHGIKTLPAPSYGWHIKLRHRGHDDTRPHVTPDPLPVEHPNLSDRAIAAGVVLQERGVLNQYWVTVLESRPWALLSSREWEVLFVKLWDVERCPLAV